LFQMSMSPFTNRKVQGQEGKRKRTDDEVDVTEASGEAKRLKPQEAKRLRKERKERRLLQKLDKEAYKKSQVKVNESLKEAFKSRKKGQRGDKDNSHDGKSSDAVLDTKGPEDDGSNKPSSSINDRQTEKEGRIHTVSIAVPGSILDNAQTPQLKAYLAGQIARAAGVFNVAEIVVYDDTGGGAARACELMARNLEYLETPPYLRKHLFDMHPDLQYVGLMPPLDIPHHLRKDEALPYREGVTSGKPMKEGKDGTFVFVGLENDCLVDKRLPEGVRITVKFDNPSADYVLKKGGKLKGSVVSPSLPRTESGHYWGYTVRIAKNLNAVFSECPFRDCDGYDLTIGTSDKGHPVSRLKLELDVPMKHVLIVFGGVEGLEYALENDETLTESEVSRLFHHYVNTCASQGSRTIRTEEAILISMTSLTPIIYNCLR